MGLFGRGKRQTRIASVAQKLATGELWHDPALTAGVSAVEQGHLQAGLALLRESRYDYEQRSYRLGALSNSALGRSGEIYDLFTEGMPTEEAADVLLWMGATLVHEAWEIRGGGFADTVGEGRYKLFFASLGAAEEPLLEAARRRPDDPVPWSEMLAYAMGMQLDRQQEDAIWDNVAQRHRSLYRANWLRLQALCRKWGGSHEDMFAFARQTVDVLPPGHPASAMLPMAHYEYLSGLFIEMVLNQERTLAFATLETDYWEAGLVAELKSAAAKWCTAAPRPHPDDLKGHHLFGWSLYRADAPEAARWHLAQVGNLLLGTPWDCMGDEREELAEAMVDLKMF